MNRWATLSIIEEDRDRLKAEVARLRAALTVYADPGRWYDGGDGGDDDVRVPVFEGPTMEPWTIAQEALKGK